MELIAGKFKIRLSNRRDAGVRGFPIFASISAGWTVPEPMIKRKKDRDLKFVNKLVLTLSKKCFFFCFFDNEGR